MFAQSATPSSDAIVERNVTYCELAKDPAAYNRALVRLTAFVTHGFEDFHLAEPICPNPPEHFSTWIMYGGDIESNTVYCCPGEASGETRPKTLEVEGIQIPLVTDGVFQQFRDLLKKDADTTVRATLVGRFFSGKRLAVKGPTFWSGYGHLGCCSLFVIQRVEWFELHARSDLDYTAEAGWNEPERCKVDSLRWLRHISIAYFDGTAEQAVEEQKLADDGTHAWAFGDPQRVAVESLKPFYGDQVPVLRNLKNTPARQVFQWKNGKKSVIIVVTKPYWLSFYSNSGSVAWVSTMVKEADCH